MRSSKVLTVGPSLKGTGGMASVLCSYKCCIPGFHFSATNSCHGTFAGLFNLVGTLVKMPFCRMAGYNILHVHGCSGKSFIRKRFVMAWGRLLGFRIVFHCHGGAFVDFSEKYGAGRISHVLRKCSAMIVLGQYWKETFARNFGVADAFILPNIVEKPRKEPEYRTDISKDSPLRVVFLGTIARNKGIYDIVEALRRLRDEYEGRIEVTFAGDGEIDRLREAIDNAGVGSMTKVVGKVLGESKYRLLDSSDLMLLPSYYEGLPITLLEACAWGMPSVSTPVGSIAELIHDGVNGTLVEPGHPEQIAAALRKYVDNPELLAEHGSAARQAVGPHFPENVTAKLQEIYSFVSSKS